MWCIKSGTLTESSEWETRKYPCLHFHAPLDVFKSRFRGEIRLFFGSLGASDSQFHWKQINLPCATKSFCKHFARLFGNAREYISVSRTSNILASSPCADDKWKSRASKKGRAEIDTSKRSSNILISGELFQISNNNIADCLKAQHEILISSSSKVTF